MMRNVVSIAVVCAAMELGLGVGFAAGLPENPYRAIAARNCFQLVPPAPPPPPPTEEVTVPPVLPPVVVTGVTDLSGRPQAILEMEGGSTKGQAALLEKGQLFGGLRVLDIDVRSSTVKVAFGGGESVLPWIKVGSRSAPAPNPAPMPKIPLKGIR